MVNFFVLLIFFCFVFLHTKIWDGFCLAGKQKLKRTFLHYVLNIYFLSLDEREEIKLSTRDFILKLDGICLFLEQIKTTDLSPKAWYF